MYNYNYIDIDIDIVVIFVRSNYYQTVYTHISRRLPRTPAITKTKTKLLLKPN